MRRIKNKNGFTFIELVIVLTLLGVLLAIAVPRLHPVSRWQLEGAAGEMAGNLRLARSEAVFSGKICRVTFFIYAGAYRLTLAENNQMIQLPEEIFFQGQTTFAKDASNNPFIYFNALGRPSGGGTVILESRDGDKRYIIVTPVTGRVRVSKEEPQHW